jgi:competence protein ComEC
LEEITTAPPRSREPALTAAALLAVGIVIDRYAGVLISQWLIGGLAIGAVAIGAQFFASRRRVAATLVAMLLVTVGGARHHQFWSLRESQSIHALAHEPGPVRVIGRVASPIAMRNNNRPGVPTWMRLDHSVFQLECESLVGPQESVIPVSGLVRVDVAGHVLHTKPGERVEIYGQLAVPNPPRNPDDFDYPEYLRMLGIDRLIRTDHPDCVRVLSQPTGPWSWPGRLSNRIREDCDWLIFDHLPADIRPVALSLLIGDRSDLKDDTETAFIRSGTMHILAISGLHIGVLAGFVWMVCRALRMRTLTASIWVIAVILGYAAITDSRPPVMRAVLLGGVLVLGRATGRQTGAMQSLAFSALVLLLYRPSDLFDVGAQLSFIAVAVIIVVSPWIAERTGESFTDQVLAGERSWLSRMLSTLGRWLLSGYLLTAIVWLVTVPITMRSFHLVAPAGLLVNALITPFSTLVLIAGYLFLGTGLLVPALAKWAAIPFSWSLSIFVKMVDWSAQLPGGYGETPAPALGWMIGFYLLLLALVMVRTARLRQWIWRGTAIWTLGWLAVTAWPETEPPGLRCTFLDVGHGEAILVECPNGGTLLYDCGSLGDGRRAARAVQSLLRQRHAGRIDAFVISHADSDHYNGGIDLVTQTPVGTTMLSSHCLQYDQEGLMELFEELAARGAALKLIQRGDQLRIDPEVQIEVLHPTPLNDDKHDNANSIVLRITYRGRILLLTGDVEKDGADELLHTPTPRIDVLMAPHHGGKTANTAEIAAWASPQHVIASSQGDVTPSLKKIYPEAQSVLATGASGAIRIEVSAEGQLTLNEFVPARAASESRK